MGDKMKRGFTLIELLAVIVILGIILAIAVPSVGRIIEESRYNSLLQIEQFVKDSAIKYLAVNNELYPTEIGTTIEIKIDELINKNFLNEVKSPWNNNKCNGYVLITKIEDNNYNFIPHLNCFENITNSVDDKLLLHYTFDDFQEPTKNLAVDFIAKMTGRMGYKVELVHNYSFPEYNTNEATRVIITGGDGVSKTPSARTIVPNSENKDRTFTTSVKVKNIGSNPVGIANNLGSIIWVDPNETKEVVMTGTGKGPGQSNYMFNIDVKKPNDELDFILYELQAEEKSYQTPYTDGEREGIIKDHSLNNNHASLELNSTPRWINSKFGGAYEFNGIDNYIVVPKPTNFDPSSDFSVSVWVYRRGGRTIISHDKLDDDTTGAFNLYANDTNVQIEKNNHAAVSTKNGTFKSKEWQHIVITYDNNEQLVKFYINGKLIDNKQIEPPKNFENELLIGRRGLATDSFFQGIIDELRIYGRVLSEMEVKLLYKRQK